MKFLKNLFFHGIIAFVLFEVIFGNIIPIPKTSICYREPQQQVQQTQKTSLIQELAEISNELGLDIQPQEWITNPNKVADLAMKELNNTMSDLYREAGLSVKPSGDFNTDANAASNAAMQQLTDILTTEGTDYDKN